MRCPRALARAEPIDHLRRELHRLAGVGRRPWPRLARAAGSRGRRPRAGPAGRAARAQPRPPAAVPAGGRAVGGGDGAWAAAPAAAGSAPTADSVDGRRWNEASAAGRRRGRSTGRLARLAAAAGGGRRSAERVWAAPAGVGRGRRTGRSGRGRRHGGGRGRTPPPFRFAHAASAERFGITFCGAMVGTTFCTGAGAVRFGPGCSTARRRPALRRCLGDAAGFGSTDVAAAAAATGSGSDRGGRRFGGLRDRLRGGFGKSSDWSGRAWRPVG